MGNDMLVAIWIVIAVVLWVHFKIAHHNEPVLPDGAPQRTFVGALMWPFYLIGYLWNEIKATGKSILDGMQDKPDDDDGDKRPPSKP